MVGLRDGMWATSTVGVTLGLHVLGGALGNIEGVQVGVSDGNTVGATVGAVGWLLGVDVG